MSSSRSAARLACRAMRASRNSVHTNSCASTSRRAPHCEQLDLRKTQQHPECELMRKPKEATHPTGASKLNSHPGEFTVTSVE